MIRYFLKTIKKKKKFKIETWSGIQQKTLFQKAQSALCSAPLAQGYTVPLPSQKEIF